MEQTLKMVTLDKRPDGEVVVHDIPWVWMWDPTVPEVQNPPYMTVLEAQLDGWKLVGPPQKIDRSIIGLPTHTWWLTRNKD